MSGSVPLSGFSRKARAFPVAYVAVHAARMGTDGRWDRRTDQQMDDYELLRQRHLADAMRLAPRLIERLGWPADRLAAHRAARLRELAGHAVKRSAWHRERLAGVDTGRLDEASLAELPTMTKTDLMDNFDRIVTDERLSLTLVNAHLETVSTGSYLLDRYTAITSGGSSGHRGVFIYDWDAWATYYLGLVRYLLRAKWSDPELASRPVVAASVMAAHFTHATAATGRTFTGPQLNVLRFPVTRPVEEIVAGLNQAQPDFLLAYPSALHLLSFEARAGRLRIAPRLVRSSAEPLLPEIRAAAEQAWGVPVANVWGTSEGGGTAVACEQARSHLSEDLLIVEPVDERGQAVAPGQRSAKVYLTNLYNLALPLIRYEITDEVTILAEPCPCGSAHRCVADIQGRLDDLFAYHGRRVHPHVFRSALGRHAGIAEYQVRQTHNGARIAVRCGAPVDLEALREEITGALAGLGLACPVVEIEVVDRLQRDPGPAKLKRFVPLSAEAHRDPDDTQRDQEAVRRSHRPRRPAGRQPAPEPGCQPEVADTRAARRRPAASRRRGVPAPKWGVTETVGRVALNGVELEYEVRGTGEPVVLIHWGVGVVWAGPLLDEPVLAGSYRLLTYHRAGYGGSSSLEEPATMAAHAAHCRLLMAKLGIERAHVIGHSSSVPVVLQLALDAPDAVHTLTLMEAARPAPPTQTQARFVQDVVQPAVQRYRAGDRSGAVDTWFRGVFGPGYRPALDRGLPGAYEQAVTGADTFFARELPALQQWSFTQDDARRIPQPVLAVLGTASHPVFAERHELLLRWLPSAEPLDLPGAGHLLHAQHPAAVAEGLAGFLARHPIPESA